MHSALRISGLVLRWFLIALAVLYVCGYLFYLWNFFQMVPFTMHNLFEMVRRMGFVTWIIGGPPPK